MWVAWLLGIFACHPTESFVLPTVGGEIAGMIFAVEGNDQLRVQAINARDPPIYFSGPSGARVTLLLYETPLDRYGIEPGVIEQVPPPHRPLPPSDRALSFGASADWVEVATRSRALRDFRIPPLAVTDCALVGGCFLNEETRRLGDCVVPCPPSPDPLLPASPAPPRPPVLFDCPTAWTATVVAVEVATCLPPERDDCAADETQSLNSASCERMAVGCDPNSPYNDALPTGTIVYVDPTALPQGDGSLGAPYARIDEALISGAQIIALAKGTHQGPLGLRDGVQLIGACPAETTIEANEPVVLVEGIGVTIRGLSVVGGVTLDVGIHAAANVSNVQLRGGAIVNGHLQATNLTIVDAAQNGLLVTGFAALQDSVIQGAGQLGILAIGSDAAVEVTGSVLDRNNNGVAASGAHAQITKSSIIGSRCYGLRASTATVVMDTVVIRDTTEACPGHGSVVAEFAQLQIDRSLILRSATDGIHLRSSSATLRDLVIDRVGNDLSFEWIGVDMTENSNVTLERAVIHDTVYRGARMYGGGQLLARDVVVRHTRANHEDAAIALLLKGRIDAELERIWIDDNERDGISFGDDSTSDIVRVDVRDLSITPKQLSLVSEYRYCALELFSGVELVGERIAVDGGPFGGIRSNADGEATLTDLTIRNIDNVAVFMGQDTRLSIDRVVLERAYSGIRVRGLSDTTLRNVTIRQMTPGETYTGRELPGEGLVVQPEDGVVTLARFEVSACERGVEVLQSGTLDAAMGTITGNTIGASIGFDPAELLERVTFVDNGLNFETLGD